MSASTLWHKIPCCFRWLLLIVLVSIILIVMSVTVLVWMCGDPDFSGKLDTTTTTVVSNSQVEANVKKEVISKIPQYHKGEEQTYLTLPEWYLVFNPNEYALYLQNGNNPSDFPFITSIDEYWKLYDRVIYLTKDIYPENSQYKTMLDVIGISTTAEFLIKSLYENTIGRLSYWTASESTPEDELIVQAHTAYGEFIYLEPWYKFPFADWLKKIWVEPPFFGPDFIRKLERKILVTLEFGFKTVYAALIGFGAESAYDPSDGQVKMHVSVLDGLSADELVKIDERITLLHDFGNGEYILSVPRWGEFTEIVPAMVVRGVEFIDIAGNDDILVTVIGGKETSAEFANAHRLFDSMVLAPAGKERWVFSVKVNALSRFIHTISSQEASLEHIYDY